MIERIVNLVDLFLHEQNLDDDPIKCLAGLLVGATEAYKKSKSSYSGQTSGFACDSWRNIAADSRALSSASVDVSQADGRSDIEADTTVISDSEGSSDCSIDDLFDIPFDLIADSANLSKHRGYRTLRISNDANNKEPFSVSQIGGIGDPLTPREAALPETVGNRENPASAAHPILDSEARPPDGTVYTKALAVQGDSVAPARMSAKRDLTTTEISPIAKHLLKDNAISFVFSNSQSISAAWTASVQATTSHSVVQSMVAAFDKVHRLTQDDRGSYLSLRFSYMQLKYAIDDLKSAASKDRLRGIRRKQGYSNASLTIDVYIYAKSNTPGQILSRETLSEYRRISSHWSDFTGGWPIQLCVYSETAETIMYAFLPLMLSILTLCKPE
jgi:hypothetical protein